MTWGTVNEGGREKLEVILPYSFKRGGEEVLSLSWKHEKYRMLSSYDYLLLLPSVVTTCHTMNLGTLPANGAGNENTRLWSVCWQPK